MTRAVAFDFGRKRIRKIDPSDASGAIAAGEYCWIETDRIVDATQRLRSLGVERATVARVANVEDHGHLHLGRASIHCAFVECRFQDGDLRQNTVHLVLGPGFLLTAHDCDSALMHRVLATFERDFRENARTGGFLLFEVVDHLISGYREALAAMSVAVDRIQSRLLGDVGDEILADVSELTRSLLDYRNAVVGARETVDELATRRSAFVEESTQPFLDRLTVPLDRLANDSATERTVLSESLNLYMGIVSHRTNKIVNRLTVVSLIFLPLNFVAAVYGMNFKMMPELEWRFGYLAFWAFTVVLVGTLLVLLRRKRWL